ncbi:MAG: enoyl-CoA hydratase/isomerase family protein [Acidiphilium sp.]
MSDNTPAFISDGMVARLRLNNPGQRNRLGAEDLAVLHVHLASLAADATVRVVVLEAAGTVFSAGFDLDALAAGELGDAEDGPGGIGAVASALAALPQPTVARLHGNIYGGAVDLVLACDFRIGAEGIEALMPAARIGLHYYRSGLARAVTRLGPDATRQLYLTAEPAGAAELLRIGYLTATAPAEGLDAAVDALAARLAANAPLAMRGMKAAIDALAAGSLDPAAFAAGLEAAHAAPEFRTAMAELRGRKLRRGG